MLGLFALRAILVHGAVMVFLVIIPSIPGSLGNFVLPIMLGAKDVAFPRMNLGSFYLWLVGAFCAVYSLYAGGFDTGWTFYTPYSTTTSFSGVIPVLIGVFILGFSSIFTGINFVVTIHKLRPPGMTWFRMPLFLWASTSARGPGTRNLCWQHTFFSQVGTALAGK